MASLPYYRACTTGLKWFVPPLSSIHWFRSVGPRQEHGFAAFGSSYFLHVLVEFMIPGARPLYRIRFRLLRSDSRDRAAPHHCSLNEVFPLMIQLGLAEKQVLLAACARE